jgi:hypothetical protein
MPSYPPETKPLFRVTNRNRAPRKSPADSRTAEAPFRNNLEGALLPSHGVAVLPREEVFGKGPGACEGGRSPTPEGRGTRVLNAEPKGAAPAPKRWPSERAIGEDVEHRRSLLKPSHSKSLTLRRLLSPCRRKRTTDANIKDSRSSRVD